MRKKQEHSKARQRLLDVAQELMLKKGFASTSIDEVCKRSNLTKGGFFHYFKSKEDLGKQLLERFCCHSQERMSSCCCGEKKLDPLKRVYRYIDYAIELSKNSSGDKGCLMGTFASELSDTSSDIRDLCVKGFDDWAKVIRKDLAEAKTKYAPKASFDVGSLAEHFVAIFEGSQILAKAKQNRKIIKNNLEHFKRYLKSLFGK